MVGEEGALLTDNADAQEWRGGLPTRSASSFARMHHTPFEVPLRATAAS